jgi:3-oxoacyl-[acyl-carrier-protein] synthase II
MTPLGDDLESVAGALYASRSGIVDICKFDVSSFITKWAGIPRYGNDNIRWPRADGYSAASVGELFYARHAVRHLLSDVNPREFYRAEQIGCIVGVDEPSMDIQRCIEFLSVCKPMVSDRRDLIKHATQFFRMSELLNTDVMSVLRVLYDEARFAGYTLCHVGLCSASLQALGMAARAIRCGKAEAMITGGISGKITPVQLGRLEGVGAVCMDPKLVGAARSRPFDSRRSGFVPAEGAALFLVEREDVVRQRGGKVYGRIAGYGSSLGAQHIVAPHTEETEMRLCIQRALDDAQIPAAAVDCISAHGSSTKLNDQHEARALSDIFCSEKPPVVTATKSLHGHLIAAAGAMEVLCVLASFEKDFVPPVLNLEKVAPELRLPIAGTVLRRRVNRVLKNSFGMGGLAASMVLENPYVKT